MSWFTNDTAYDTLIAGVATKYASQAGLDPASLAALVKAVIRAESDFDPTAYRAEPQIGDASRGLMQLLGRTARALGYGGMIGDDATRSGGLYEPATAIEYGTRLLVQNLATARGSLDVAISAYNAGFSTQRPGDAKRDARGNILNQDYVNRVLGFYRQYQPPATGPESNTVTGGTLGVGVGALGTMPPWAWAALAAGAVALALAHRARG